MTKQEMNALILSNTRKLALRDKIALACDGGQAHTNEGRAARELLALAEALEALDF